MIECDKYKPLLMGLIDNELTEAETSDVNDHLIRCSCCRNEFDDLLKVSGAMRGISFREPDEITLDNLWKNPLRRFTLWSGGFLIISGYIILAAYGLYEYFQDKGEPFAPKIGTAALIIGSFILLVTVLWSRLATYKTDKYKEIEK